MGGDLAERVISYGQSLWSTKPSVLLMIVQAPVNFRPWALWLTDTFGSETSCQRNFGP